MKVFAIILAIVVLGWVGAFEDDFMCKTFETCVPLSTQMKADLAAEIADYEKSPKFIKKINESALALGPNIRFVAVLDFLRQHAFEKNQNVLDLGCAAGAFIRFVHQELLHMGGAGNMTGVELTKGWVTAARQIHPHFTFLDKDITEVSTADFPSQKFDLITLVDVFEHVQRERYACLFEGLQSLSRPHTLLYFHLPTAYLQILSRNGPGQYYENVVFPHSLIAALACFDFHLVHYEFNRVTQCNRAFADGLPKVTRAHCTIQGYPRYMHLLFSYQPDMSIKKKMNAGA
eukprot:gene24836-30010_t